MNNVQKNEVSKFIAGFRAGMAAMGMPEAELNRLMDNLAFHSQVVLASLHAYDAAEDAETAYVATQRMAAKRADEVLPDRMAVSDKPAVMISGGVK